MAHTKFRFAGLSTHQLADLHAFTGARPTDTQRLADGLGPSGSSAGSRHGLGLQPEVDRWSRQGAFHSSIVVTLLDPKNGTPH